MSSRERESRKTIDLGIGCVLGTLTILELIDFVIHFLLHLGDLVSKSLTVYRGVAFSFGFVAIAGRARCVLRVAPCFLGRALYLIGYALVGKLLVANGVA